MEPPNTWDKHWDADIYGNGAKPGDKSYNRECYRMRPYRYSCAQIDVSRHNRVGLLDTWLLRYNPHDDNRPRGKAW